MHGRLAIFTETEVLLPLPGRTGFATLAAVSKATLRPVLFSPMPNGIDWGKSDNDAAFASARKPVRLPSF